jgi:hypothetical protein
MNMWKTTDSKIRVGQKIMIAAKDSILPTEHPIRRHRTTAPGDDGKVLAFVETLTSQR